MLMMKFTVSGKNIPNIFGCNLKKDYQILIIFDASISDTTSDQITVQFSTAPLSAFALHAETKPRKYCIFILFRLFEFSQVVQKQTLDEVGTN